MEMTWVFATCLFCLAYGHLNLDPERDPVLQRLEIPAQIVDSESEFFIGDSKPNSTQDQRVRRLQGIPDATISAKQFLNLSLPSDAFEGHVTRYEVSCNDGKPLPLWLIFDEKSSTLQGKPTVYDVGSWIIRVRAIGTQAENTDQAVFTITVTDEPDCQYLILSLKLDFNIFDLPEKKELKIKRRLADFLGISPLKIDIQKAEGDRPAEWIRAGPGNKIRAAHSKLTQAAINLPCQARDNETFWKKWEEVCQNGYLASQIGGPILGWHTTEVQDRGRSKREVEGSGNDEEIDYPLPETNEDVEPDTRVVPTLSSPVFEAPPTPTPVLTPSSSLILPKAISTPALRPIRPTRLMPSAATDVEIGPTPVITTATVFPDFTQDEDNTTSIIEASVPTSKIESSSVSTPALPRVINEGENELDEFDGKGPANPPSLMKRLQKLTVTAGKVLQFPIPPDTFNDSEDGNTRKLQLSLIPAEDRKLESILWIGFDELNQEIYGLPLSEDIGKWTFYLQARNSANLTSVEEVEIHVRQDPADRTFHHRFIFQIMAEYTPEEIKFPRAHWLLKIVNSLQKTVGDANKDSIIVREVIGAVETENEFTFSWSNKSLSRTHCPEDDIQDIFDKLYYEKEATADLDKSLSPQFSVIAASFELEGICKPIPTVPSTVTESPALGPQGREKSSTAPELRNPVDQIEAQVGVLLRKQVPEDTFSDKEDGTTRMMYVTLMGNSRQPLDPKSWLQFDSKNQEFYGLPLEKDIGNEEYQLRCVDSSGLEVYDSLVVAVNSDPKAGQHSVEFSLTIDSNFDSIISSAQRKVRLVEALANLFGDSDTRHIAIHSFNPGSTVVTWHNMSLATKPCPHAEITNLRKILMDDDKKLTQRCIEILSAADFVPKNASVVPLDTCISELTPTHGPDSDQGKEEDGEKAAGGSSWTDDYLVTFIVPGIIIALMLLLAAVIACILYRRRRTGKLGLEERRGFVSKGIPIIFAEELEERPSGRQPAKAPVILKEEKPAQPPPDYHKARSSSSPHPPHKIAPEQQDLLRTPSDEVDEEPASLYQPPPPVASANRDSTRSARPKATPAYRKPPPYVPP